jgi:hypothetical protein
MRTFTTEEQLYLTTAQTQLRDRLDELAATDIDAPAGMTQAGQDAAYDRIDGVIQEFMNAKRLRELLVELQTQRIADVEAQAVAAFAPFFDCGARCKVRAQETDLFRAEAHRLSAIQSGGVDGARAALLILDREFQP